jgi:hypothetical protein
VECGSIIKSGISGGQKGRKNWKTLLSITTMIKKFYEVKIHETLFWLLEYLQTEVAKSRKS